MLTTIACNIWTGKKAVTELYRCAEMKVLFESGLWISGYIGTYDIGYYEHLYDTFDMLYCDLLPMTLTFRGCTLPLPCRFGSAPAGTLNSISSNRKLMDMLWLFFYDTLYKTFFDSLVVAIPGVAPFFPCLNVFLRRKLFLLQNKGPTTDDDLWHWVLNNTFSFINVLTFLTNFAVTFVDFFPHTPYYFLNDTMSVFSKLFWDFWNTLSNTIQYNDSFMTLGHQEPSKHKIK